MSVQNTIRRLTAPDIRARKGGDPIVSLTSYHAHTARIVDAYCDVILVGDSLGMVMHGLETTIPVTLEMMILQGLAVMRGSQRALVAVAAFTALKLEAQAAKFGQSALNVGLSRTEIIEAVIQTGPYSGLAPALNALAALSQGLR